MKNLFEIQTYLSAPSHALFLGNYHSLIDKL